MSRMDHRQATSTGAAERYALNQMSEQERDLYEEHFFGCPECAQEARAAALFVDTAKVVLRQDTGVRSDATIRPAPRAFWSKLVGFVQPFPVTAFASACLLALVGYQAFVQIPALRRQVRDAERLQAAPAYFLSVSRSESPTIVVSNEQRFVSLTLSRSFDRLFPLYRCEIRDTSDHIVLAETMRPPAQDGELQLIVPVAQLQPGRYVIKIAGLETERAPSGSTAEYPFTLERRDVRDADRER